MSKRFENILWGIDGEIRETLNKLPTVTKQNTQEIRLRRGLPLALTVYGETVFVKKDGQTSLYPQNDLQFVSKENVENSFRKLCKNSAFAHEEELKNGYLKLDNGYRAGIFGTVNSKGNMEEVTCINIRIAREIKGVANKIAHSFRGEGWLIAGPPASGKTTFLRDFIRQISNGTGGKNYRVAVIDSRGEIGGSGENDLGLSTDVLNIKDKALGVEIALRTMFPEVIAFDEIGNLEELNQVKQSLNAGVSVITTAHIGSVSELLQRDVTRELLKSGAISRVALLSKALGGEIRVLTDREISDDCI
ncbi:MAG: Flp pilus assembly complex ATPase component TadA [Clostridia bacterium]|nr:Flp pilus assembly complex ATPase component TadA [Clostridia bacterium]